MAKNSIRRNYIYNVSYQVLTLLAPIITTPYTARVLGAEGVGLYSYTFSIVSYFTLFAALGTSRYAQREVAYSQEDKKRASRTFWEVFILRTITGSISLFAYMMYLTAIEDKTIYLIQGMYIFSEIFDITWFFQGLEEFKKIILRNFSVKIILIAFIFIFIKDSNDLLLYVFGMAFLVLLGNISIWLYLPKYLCKVAGKDIKPFRNLNAVMLLFVPAVATQVYTVLDKTMIGMFTDTSFENGYYEQAINIVKMSMTIVTSLGTVMLPRIAYTFAQKDEESLKKYIYKSYRFVWLMATPIFFGLAAVADMAVPWFLGPGYDKVSVLIPILSLLVIVIGLSNVTGVQYLIPTQKQKIFNISVIAGAGVNIVLNFFLIPRYFSVGAAAASIIAECVVTAVQFIYVIRIEKYFEFHKIFGPAAKYFLCAGVMFIILSILKLYLNEMVISTIIMIVLGNIIYFGLLLIFKDEFFMDILNKMIESVRNKL